MYMQLQMVQVMILALRADGEHCQTIFNKAERLLNDAEYQAALGFVAKSKKMDAYISVMDFLFCEIAGSPWPQRCRSYYKGHGKRVKEQMTRKEILLWDRILCAALRLAVKYHKVNQEKTWTRFRIDVQKTFSNSTNDFYKLLYT